MHDTRYDQVLAACALTPDLNLMPAGDLTEIGEKGINLSGGQKQRVSLARAAFSNAGIYLLDDPLSAVDVHVGRSIFDQLLGPNGLLKETTRVFVTNSLSFLPQFDRILMVEDGRVVEEGSYAELTRQPGPFTEFIRIFAESRQTSTGDGSSSEVVGLVEENKAGRGKGAGIVVRERIESGQVKASVVWEYLRACGLWLTVVFLVLRTASYVSGVGANFWLSDWSDEAGTAGTHAVKSKFYRLAIYTLLCFTDRK